jgi:hypothetical protein
VKLAEAPGDPKLVRLFTSRSWVLDVLIRLEPGAHRLLRTAKILAQIVPGCLRKSTACTVSGLTAVGKNGLGTANFVGGTRCARPLRAEVCAARSLAQVRPGAK